MNTRPGFTIVELLIVIVVIAVLAAITVVAFNGVQTRAKNNSQIQAASAYIRLFRLYKVQNNETLPTNYGCLGRNNIDTNGDGNVDCGDNGNRTVNETLLAQLETVGKLPNVVTDQITGTDTIRRGGMFYDSTYIVWFLNGVTSCGVPGAALGGSGNSQYCLFPVTSI